MSIVDVYNPTFQDFHGEPMVLWRDRAGVDPRVSVDLLAKYRRWQQDQKGPKYDLPDVFWQAHGPAVVRALRYCHASALIFDWASDRKVAYKWFAKKAGTTGADWYHVCPVSAEGTGNVRVLVTLPTDEDVSFMFSAAHMKEWLKPAKVEVAP